MTGISAKKALKYHTTGTLIQGIAGIVFILIGYKLTSLLILYKLKINFMSLKKLLKFLGLPPFVTEMTIFLVIEIRCIKVLGRTLVKSFKLQTN